MQAFSLMKYIRILHFRLLIIVKDLINFGGEYKVVQCLQVTHFKFYFSWIEPFLSVSRTLTSP